MPLITIHTQMLNRLLNTAFEHGKNDLWYEHFEEWREEQVQKLIVRPNKTTDAR